MFSIGDEIKDGNHPGLAKLVEEMSELNVELAKLMMTKGDFNYWGGRDLRQGIIDEIGDVLAAIKFFTVTSKLDLDAMFARSDAKYQLFKAWQNGDATASLEDFLFTTNDESDIITT